MTYSIDFRRKVLAIKEHENLSFKAAAQRFGVGKASVSRWSGRVEPCRKRAKPPVKIKDEALRRDVELHPDAYQHERAARLGASRQGICEALKRLKITLKKNAAASEGRRAGPRRVPGAA